MSRQVKNSVCEDPWTIVEYRVRGRVARSIWEKALKQIDDRIWSSIEMSIANPTTLQVEHVPDE